MSAEKKDRVADAELDALWKEGLSSEEYGRLAEKLGRSGEIQIPGTLRRRLELIPVRVKAHQREEQSSGSHASRWKAATVVAAVAVIVLISLYSTQGRQSHGNEALTERANQYIASVLDDEGADNPLNEDPLLLDGI